ncbi:hypothetical protein JYB87_04700 [Shewanella avicenniae]|uniref:Uncharacterized protein n=1 Tax=Shewanella avicenniae TaxID=2814294 RepID=A0ABX7QV93_9GAMM|nr:hypothetical protein [Shewanella avicenniae]QSX34553.1 hypothetical protein JYB87_04700 [Shewanella avicenniae]
MNYVESYILLSGMLIAGLLYLRNLRRQQLVDYIRQSYAPSFQLLADEFDDSDTLFQDILRAIKLGQLAVDDDLQLQRFYYQLQWLNWLPVLTLILGFLLAAWIQP